MAADYLTEIQAIQPRGPYLIGGWCMGGFIALELAHLVKAAGEEVELLVLIETPHPSYPKSLPRTTIFHRLIYNLIERIGYEVRTTRALKMSHLWRNTDRVMDAAQAFAERLVDMPLSKLHLKVPHSQAYKLHRLYDMHEKAYKAHTPRPYQGRVVLFRASKQRHRIQPDPTLGWGDLLKGELELREIPGYYLNLMVEPSVRLLAGELKNCLRRSENYVRARGKV
jgi:thioesterase domain-containing protein